MWLAIRYEKKRFVGKSKKMVLYLFLYPHDTSRCESQVTTCRKLQAVVEVFNTVIEIIFQVYASNTSSIDHTSAHG